MSDTRLQLKRRRLRNYFTIFETAEKTEKEIEDELSTKGMEYVQMKLPVSKITPEFEAKVKEKVDKNILHAKMRVASENDLESVVYLHNRSWMTSSTPFSPIDVATIRKIFEYPETSILIAKVYGSDSGFVILDLEGENHEFGIIAGLGVLPRFQRKGLGTVLGMAAWAHFKKIGVKELRCEVYKFNLVSYNFIKSLGFEEFGVKVYKREDFVIDDNQ
jgi:ribosomal protein S18 acetylase RimI-like enzyme